MKKARRRQLAAGELASRQEAGNWLLARWPNKETLSSGQLPAACRAYRKPYNPRSVL